MEQNSKGLTVFYDGACRVCSMEIERYRLRDKDGLLTLIDIAAPTFDPAQYDRDLQMFMKKLHVLDDSGNFHTGVDALTRIWAVMPQPELHLLSAVVALPGVNLLASSGYWLFARCRKLLP